MQPQQRLVFSVLAIIILILAVGGFIWRDNISAWMTYTFAPSDVKAMLFLEGDGTQRSLAYIEGGALTHVSYDGKNFFDITRHDGTIYAVLEDTTGAVDIYTVGDLEPMPLTNDGKEKRGVSVSEDGQYLAFSYADYPQTQSGVPYFDIDGFTLAVMDLATGKVTTYGNGAHATFIHDDMLFFVSADGFETLDLKTGTRTSLASASSARFVTEPPMFGADGNFLLRNALLSNGQYGLYHLESENPLRFVPVATVAPEEGSSIDAAALSDSEPYVVTTDATGHQRITHAGATVLVIPAETHIMYATF